MKSAAVHTGKRSAGFTLLEVLVALGIVAVISLLSWRGLEEVLRSANRVTLVDDQVQTTMAVFAQMESDLAALELMPGKASPTDDALEVSPRGLLIRFTERNTSRPPYRQEVEWILEGSLLTRVAQNEQGPDMPTVSEAVPTQGLQIRLWLEPGGWTSPASFGEPAPLEFGELALQGSPLLLNTNTQPAMPPTDGEGDMPSRPETPVIPVQQSLIRAVEVRLTQPNRQAVSKVFLTGGVY